MATINNLSTNIIPSVFGGNIIRNVYNLGGSTACDAGSKYCTEGYGLYFPCLKSITKGQDVCFDFYVTDKATQDVVDLRDIDGISLELIGAFGCPFGTFSYPDNITSLQSREFEPIYQNHFSPTDRCHLTFEAVCGEIAINTLENDFYYGTEVTLMAKDTPKHIFVGWIIDGELPCENPVNGNDGNPNEYTFTIMEDTYIAALYRPRKRYTLTIDNDNKNSHFDVVYYNLNDEYANWNLICQTEGKHIHILEGHHFGVACFPNSIMFGSDPDERDYSYEFIAWKDGVKKNPRIFCAGKDTSAFEDDGTIYLLAKCRKTEYNDEIIFIKPSMQIDEFDEEGIHIMTTPAKEEEYCEFEDENLIFSKDVKKYIYNGNGYLYFDEGIAEFSPSIHGNLSEEGVKICLVAMSQGESSCELKVKVNDMETSQVISNDEFMMYEYYFRPCNDSTIEISSDGICMIDYMEIYKENIIDKGKATLCLGSDVTSNLPSGKLSVGGAISVDGKIWGLPLTQIGEVNRLTKINIL